MADAIEQPPHRQVMPLICKHSRTSVFRLAARGSGPFSLASAGVLVADEAASCLRVQVLI